MDVTRKEVLADYSLKMSRDYSYLSVTAQGHVDIFCDYEGEGIWLKRGDENPGSPECSLSLSLLEDLRDWNWLYDLYRLGSYPDYDGPWQDEPEIIDEFTQTGKELACRVKLEAPLCRVIFWDEMAWRRSELEAPLRAFNYAVLINAAGQPWLCHIPEPGLFGKNKDNLDRPQRRFQQKESRERSKVFRAALRQQLVLCKNVRTVDMRTVYGNDESGKGAKEVAGYVISLGRRKNHETPPLKEYANIIQNIIFQCLTHGESIAYRHRALWIISEKYEISFSIEAYNTNATMTVHMDDQRSTDIHAYGGSAGEPTVEPLYRMGTAHAFKRARSLYPREPSLPAIMHHMGCDSMISQYPNPADRFAASVKLCSQQHSKADEQCSVGHTGEIFLPGKGGDMAGG